MFSQFRYWSMSRIIFVLFYLSINVGIGFCFYKAFTTPKLQVPAIVLKKDSGISESGVPKYFVEVSVKDSTKQFRQEIQYGFVWDTIDVKEQIIVEKYPLITWLYGFGIFILLILDIIFADTFGKLVLRLRN